MIEDINSLYNLINMAPLQNLQLRPNNYQPLDVKYYVDGLHDSVHLQITINENVTTDALNHFFATIYDAAIDTLIIEFDLDDYDPNNFNHNNQLLINYTLQRLENVTKVKYLIFNGLIRGGIPTETAGTFAATISHRSNLHTLRINGVWSSGNDEEGLDAEFFRHMFLGINNIKDLSYLILDHDIYAENDKEAMDIFVDFLKNFQGHTVYLGSNICYRFRYHCITEQEHGINIADKICVNPNGKLMNLRAHTGFNFDLDWGLNYIITDLSIKRIEFRLLRRQYMKDLISVNLSEASKRCMELPGDIFNKIFRMFYERTVAKIYPGRSHYEQIQLFIKDVQKMRSLLIERGDLPAYNPNDKVYMSIRKDILFFSASSKCNESVTVNQIEEQKKCLELRAWNQLKASIA